MADTEAAIGGQASDYRSQPVEGNQTDRPRYNRVVANAMYPEKEQGIIIEGKDHSTPLERYVEALAMIVSPSHITYASKISNNRVCIFLSSKQLVDDVTEKYKTINIEGSSQNIRSLVSRQKRIVISNVYPMIPNAVIEDELDKLKVIRSSQVSFLRAGFGKEQFTHILSFRRQVFVPEDSVSKIPEAILITYKGERNWIYMSSGIIKCFHCKEEGHIAKNCKNLDVNPNQSEDVIENNVSPDNEQSDKVLSYHEFPPLDQGKPVKRALSQITSVPTNESSELQEGQFNHPQGRIKDAAKQNKKKKMKVARENPISSGSTKKSIVEQLAPVKERIEGSNNVLTYDQLKDFLENTYGVSNPLQISLSYTKETGKLIEMLKEIYPLLSDRGIKSRFTRIMKKLKDPVLSDSSRESSDNEITSEDFQT